MRILVVNVNTTESMTETIAAAARAVAEPGTEIVGLTPYIGADSVEGNYESYLAAIAVADRVLAYEEPYDERAALKGRMAFYDDKHPRIKVVANDAPA